MYLFKEGLNFDVGFISHQRNHIVSDLLFQSINAHSELRRLALLKCDELNDIKWLIYQFPEE